MSKSIIASVPTWYIAHNDNDVFHCGKVEAGQHIITGQPKLETFDTESGWNNRKIVLGILES